ncbi:AraC family transcriptional regulator [Erythrobacter sp. THAF29]|uniref:helix-turn-helix domain-containing protein n=1 Tax=Erythrobacter sp. THAF29 TaxID=2587851 RepID=UPI0012691F20|nr:AraC family transcriptional regulator [Erythrobacter sp. THAF29]QFT76180.1 Helix-turn-helix domain protein [Erythrobacter sp. THAF29]
MASAESEFAIPGVSTPAMRSALGHTRDGEPLSNNRAPAEDLAPWVARVYATQVEMGPDDVLSCGLISDTPVMRVLFAGEWTAETRDGIGRYGPSALLFGAQTKRMAVSVKGSFATVGVALKPGAMSALKGPRAEDTLDRIILYDHIYGHKEWGSSARMIHWFDPAGPAERWLKVAEKLFRQLVDRAGGAKPDPVIESFDRAVFVDPNLNIAEFAEENAIERRSLERKIKRAYGQTATQVLRRARALDIAAHLRGVADDRESEEAALKFFDQSHMIREFRAFFGMTPRQFASTPQPFMTLTLEARQSRRMEIIGKAAPAGNYPWRR